MSRLSDPLDTDAVFPRLEVYTLDHGEQVLPDRFRSWGVLLFYRAHW